MSNVAEKPPTIRVRPTCGVNRGKNQHLPCIEIALCGSTVEEVEGALVPTALFSLEQAAIVVANIVKAMAEAPRVCAECPKEGSH